MTIKELYLTISLIIVFSIRTFSTFMLLPTFNIYGISLYKTNELLIGLAIGIYSFTQALFQIPLGLMSDHFGRKPIIIIGLIIFIIGSIITALSHSIWGVIIGRAIQGIGAIGSVIMATISDIIREQNHTKATALIGISFGINFAISIMLGPVITNSFGLNTIFWITAFLSLISILIVKYIIPDIKRYSVKNNSYIVNDALIKVLINSNLLKINFSIMCLHILLMLTFAVLPKQMIILGFSINNHWKVYLITILLSFISITPFIIYAELKHKIRQIFLICVILMIITEILLWQSNSSLWKLILGIQIFFFSFNLIETLLPSLISKQSPTEYKGTSMGVYSTSQFIGIAIGSFLGGCINKIFNFKIIFLTEIILTIIWLIIAFTMKDPPYLIRLDIKIPNNVKISEKMITFLKTKKGIHDILIFPKEHIICFKIDNKIISKSDIEKMLDYSSNFSCIKD